jgi:hypothetical protein
MRETGAEKNGQEIVRVVNHKFNADTRRGQSSSIQ